MTPTSKNILRNSINVFLASSDNDKENYILSVQKNLNDHKNALNTIGVGYAQNIVDAGNVFLRLFGQKKKQQIKNRKYESS